MGKQLLDGGVKGLPVFLPFLIQSQIGQCGKEFRDGIIHLKPAFLVQHHHGHRGDRLGHRVNSEQRIQVHGFVIVEPVSSHRFVVHDFSMPCDHGDETGVLPLINPSLCVLRNFFKSFAGESNLLRIDFWKFRRLDDGGD